MLCRPLQFVSVAPFGSEWEVARRLRYLSESIEDWWTTLQRPPFSPALSCCPHRCC